MTQHYALTRANRTNLKKLADYLESLPEDYQHFEMKDYAGVHTTDVILIDYALNNGGLYNKCGTVGCALGHGPAAGVLMSRQRSEVYLNWQDQLTVDWEHYGRRFVPDEEDRLWQFLFGSSWTNYDNHHYGAAARIRFILAGNEIPVEYRKSGWSNNAVVVPMYKEYRK